MPSSVKLKDCRNLIEMDKWLIIFNILTSDRYWID